MKRLGNGIGSVYKLSGTRSKPWTARKTIGWNEKGHPKYKYIGYYRTKADAMAALMEFNKSPFSLNGERLCDVFDKFMVNYKLTRAESSVKSTLTRWKHLEPLSQVRMADLTRKDIQSYFDRMEASVIVKKKVRILLRMLFDCAIRYDIIPPEKKALLDYLDLTSHIEASKNPHIRIEPEEIDRLYQINDDIARFLLFMIYTGLRISEFCNMTEESIDEDMVIHITKAKTAAGIRDIPLSDKAQNLLPLPVFHGYEDIKYKYRIWKEKNGFDHKFHDTRHTCISMLTEAGIDSRVIRSIVGHTGAGVTEQVYTHISIETKREALNKI